MPSCFFFLSISKKKFNELMQDMAESLGEDLDELCRRLQESLETDEDDGDQGQQHHRHQQDFKQGDGGSSLAAIGARHRRNTETPPIQVLFRAIGEK